MKNVQLLLLFLVCIVNGYGQIAKSYGHVVVEITKEKGTVSTKVEVKSAFPGGDSLWTQSLEKTLNQIRLGKRPKRGKYIVSVQFIVDKEGRFADVHCENDPGLGLCQEVVRAIKKSEKWGSGEVRPYHRSSITFQVSN